jgi:hypothetical protein
MWKRLIAALEDGEEEGAEDDEAALEDGEETVVGG